MRYFFLSFFCCVLATAFTQSVDADPLTGSVNATISLWTSSSGNLKLPVGLVYYGNGLKVNEGESSAGMGWNLQTGGAVVRRLNGLPDDLVGAMSGSNRNGWLHNNFAKQANDFSPSGDLNLSTCADEVQDWNKLNAFANINDTEPDLFSFHAPGLSGSFVFDRSKKTQTLPFQDLKIVTYRDTDSLINKIEITTNLGIQYTFDAGDKVYRIASKSSTVNRQAVEYNYFAIPAQYYQSWNLTKIISPAGGMIVLAYTTMEQVISTNYYREVNNSGSVDSVHSFTDTYTLKRLQSVTGKNETVTFSWDGNLLGSVNILDNTYSTSRKFNLKYNYVKRNGLSAKMKRAFLSQVSQEVNCASFPAYKFEYYGVNFSTNTTDIPFNTSLKQDIFGYYNGSATSEVPEIYVKGGDAGTDGERYRIYPANGYTPLGSGGGRVVDTSKVYFGSLQKLILPSGGYSQIKYEAVDYYDQVTSSNQYGAGVRVKQIKISSNDAASDIIKKFSYHNSASQSTGRWTYPPMYVIPDASAIRIPDNLSPDESILHSLVQVSETGRGKIIYEFLNAGMYPQTSSGDFSASQSRIARPDAAGGPCVSVGSLRTEFYTYPYAPNTNYQFEQGLPDKVTFYSRDNKIVSQKIYSYQRTTLPVAQVSGIRYELFNGIFQYAKYTLLANVNKRALTITSRAYDQSDVSNSRYVEEITSHTYNGNQMLSKQESTNSDNSLLSLSYKYAKDYNTTGTDLQSQMINGLINTNQHATVIEAITRNGSEVTSAWLHLFDNTFGNNRVFPKKRLTLSDASGFSESAIVGNTFTYSSSSYFPSLYFDAYDAGGYPVITRNHRRQASSVITGVNGTVPVLDISNARYDQLAYIDFEPQTSTASTFNGSTSTDSWSGLKSASMTSTNTISQLAVNKAPGKFYRFSCWAKAASSVDISVQVNSGSGWSANSINYPAPVNTWKYIEKRIDMSAIPDNTIFSFQLKSNASLLLDNVAFYPESAAITAYAYEPLNGKTAELDGRGNAVFQEYDALGRVHFTRNQDKDIVVINDYHYKSSGSVLPSSHFVGSTSPNIGISTSYTADQNCVPGLSYGWYIDEVLQAGFTGTVFNYQFTENKDYRVKLVVNSNSGESSTETIVHPLPVITASASLATGESFSFNCRDATFQRTVNIALTGCYDAAHVVYTWSGPGIATSVQTTTPTYTFSLASGQNNVLTCKVQARCKNQATGNWDLVPLVTVTRTITWTIVSPC